MTSLTPEQINRLSSLGISVPNESITNTTLSISNPSLGQNSLQTNTSNSTTTLLPLLSISGFTIISLGGLILFKTKSDSPVAAPPSQDINRPSTINNPAPTQVPKSIQHYLLASQQYFSQALQAQSAKTTNEPNSQLVNLLNQSILAANSAIKEFPQDYRGYYQRSRIYQSLLQSQPQLISQAITDLATASRLNPTSAELTRELATLYAKTGDANMTLTYLAQTVVLEPTKAQNFYDLARLQQQSGLLPAALDTYNRLLPLITDNSQKQQVQTEVDSLKKLVAQTTPSDEENLVRADRRVSPSSEISPTPKIDSPLIQAQTDSNIIIAAPETRSNIEVKDQTDSNALSGTLTLPANQSSVVLQNSNINSTSQVYLTITYGGKNQNLQVLSKSSGSATIGLDSPTNEEIKFKWWIIN